MFSSCFKDEYVWKSYHKSIFLGDDSFQLKGTIYDRNGNQASGNEITAIVAYHYYDYWYIKGTINDSKFIIDINKSDENGIVLPFNDPYHYLGTAWDFFTPYYTYIYRNSSERDIKICSIKLFLDDFNDDIFIREFTKGKPPKILWEIDEYISYIYVTEPFKISGEYEIDEGYWIYDCDFSKPGWYKLINFENRKINNNASYNSINNTKFFVEYF